MFTVKRCMAVGLILVFMVGLLALVGCGGKQAEQSKKVRVGIVLSTGGKGDKSFNDAAIAGLERAKKELDIEYKDVQPKDVSDDQKSLEFLAKEGYDLVIGVGFMMGDAVAKAAANYPKTKFAIIDYSYGPGKTPPNVLELTFKEHEGSFLAGVFAALMSKSGTVGFVGGMDMPLIHRFEGGFTAGVKAVRPDAKILVGYAGTTGDAFNNPAKGKEIALDQISKGADIIYHAAGGTGQGVFEAAEIKGIKAIGVDSNQNWVKPGVVIASMLKRVDVAVFNTVKAVKEGNFQGGKTQVFGLKEDGVGLTDLEKLTPEETTGISPADQEKIKQVKAEIPKQVRDTVAQFKADIVAGKVQVPDWITGKPK